MIRAGAHNTIVTSRAGKDLISCLVSGLLTIGPRFGGAIDDAARFFQVWPRTPSPVSLVTPLNACIARRGKERLLLVSVIRGGHPWWSQDACDKGLEPDEFVEDMKKKGIRVAGIGHRIKSKVSLHGCPLLAARRHF